MVTNAIRGENAELFQAQAELFWHGPENLPDSSEN
jgi:hypothetical protein